MSELYDILVETPPTKVILLALDQGLWDCERSLAELSALCEANHMEAVAEVTQKRQTPETGIVLGSGKLEEAHLAAEELGAAEIAVVSRTGELNYENLAERYGDRAFYLINTTPVGMFPREDGMAADPADFPALRGALDAVYNPLRSDFVLRAQAKGVPATGGLYMLAAQDSRLRRPADADRTGCGGGIRLRFGDPGGGNGFAGVAGGFDRAPQSGVHRDAWQRQNHGGTAGGRPAQPGIH